VHRAIHILGDSSLPFLFRLTSVRFYSFPRQCSTGGMQKLLGINKPVLRFDKTDPRKQSAKSGYDFILVATIAKAILSLSFTLMLPPATITGVMWYSVCSKKTSPIATN